MVEIPPPVVQLKSSSINDMNKTTLEAALTSASAVSVEVSAVQQDKKFSSLEPLKKPPAVLRAVNVHEIDVSDSETEEEKCDESLNTKYRHQVHEEAATKKIKKSQAQTTTSTTSTTKTTSTQQRDSL